MNRNWINEYIHLMFGNNHTLETMAVASDIKYKYMPSVLYKYRSISSFTISALENDYLVSSSVDGFNDNLEVPIAIENKLDFCYSFLFEEFDIPNIIRPYISKPHSDSFVNKTQYAEIVEAAVTQIVSHSKNMYNLLCFSERPDIQPMWAHYANNNTGFCVGYNLKEEHTLADVTLPVIYSSDLDVHRINVSTYKEISDGSMIMYASTLKNKDWQYEREWRTFFLPSQIDIKKEKMPIPKIVYLGSKISKDDQKLLTSICQKKSIPVYKYKKNAIFSSMELESIWLP